jgi:hypothetical protein
VSNIIRIDADKFDQRRLQWEDGEPYSGYATPLNAVLGADKQGRRPKMTGTFVFLFDKGLDHLIADKALTMRQLRVLATMLMRSRVDGDEFEIKPGSTGEALGISASRVSIAITDLEAGGYLTRTRKGFIKINPAFAWRGNASVRESALKKEKEA